MFLMMSNSESALPPAPPLPLMDAFLREVQQGRIPDVTLLQAHHHSCPPSPRPPWDLRAFLTGSNKHGDTPFLVAARAGHVTLLEVLHRQHSVPLEQRNADGKTALHEAAQNGRDWCIQFLAGQGVVVDALKRADWTPLMLACTKGRLATVRWLVGCGASLELQNKDGWTPLHIACRHGNQDIVRFLLDVHPKCWNTVSKNGRTPLHTAALHGNLETAQLLWQRGSYSAESADSCGVAPLMDAARGNHVPLMVYLLDTCQAGLAGMDVLGRQALHHAAQGGAGEAIQCLAGRGAGVNDSASINSLTPLHYAAKLGRPGSCHSSTPQGWG